MSDESKIYVVVACDFSDEIMEKIQNISDDLRVEQHFPTVPESVLAEAEVLYTVRTFPDPNQVPRLRWIQLHSAGVDGALRHAIIQAEDVEVTSASGIHATPIAEYCIAMMLAFTYKIPTMMQLKAAVQWPEKKTEVFGPHGLREQTIGIVGYGSIGRELGRIASTMGMRVLATKRNLMETSDYDGYTEPGTGDPEGEIPDRLYPPEALASMAAESDFLVVTAPLTEQTRHMIDEHVLKAMKKSAYLINIGRGAIVDEAALISALAREEIAGAALDVFETEPLPATSPLWNLDNVIISPHVSGNNSRYHERAARLFMENLRRYGDKQPLLNLVRREHGY